MLISTQLYQTKFTKQFMYTRLDGYDYDLLISAVEYTHLRFNHDEEFVEDLEILLTKLKTSRPLLPERT